MPRTPEPLRHIPEDELHAYLDQALSRSQCVEIEHHLAGCPGCRAERDAIAALRDRTTALLVTAAPRRIRPRPYAELSPTFHQAPSLRSRRLHNAAWAASVVAALGLGWGMNHWFESGVPADPIASNIVPPAQGNPVTTVTPAGNSMEVESPAPEALATRTEATPRRRTSPPSPPAASPAQPEALPVAQIDPPRPPGTSLSSLGGTSADKEPVLTGVWRTVSFANDQSERDDWVPRVEGVPVVQVKQQQAPQGGRPITLVTQLLANGEVISTVEGPAPEVAALLSQQSGQSASAELQDMEIASPPLPLDGSTPAAPARSAPRTLAIFGSAPSDSLKAFMLRVK
ncbi:MAG: anti-sigma factor [Gemmatimonadales bacterium]